MTNKNNIQVSLLIPIFLFYFNIFHSWYFLIFHYRIKSNNKNVKITSPDQSMQERVKFGKLME